MFDRDWTDCQINKSDKSCGIILVFDNWFDRCLKGLTWQRFLKVIDIKWLKVTSDIVIVWIDRLVRWHERDFDISSSIRLLTEVRQIMQRWDKPQTSCVRVKNSSKIQGIQIKNPIKSHRFSTQSLAPVVELIDSKPLDIHLALLPAFCSTLRCTNCSVTLNPKLVQ